MSGGSGLGLAIAKKMIDAQKSKMMEKSDPVQVQSLISH